MDEPIAAFLDGLPVARERVVAVGWATVDLDRAVGQLDGHGPFEPAPDEPLLGARSLRLRVAGGPDVVLLEPSTEGRLAASLARHGEGPIAAWVLPGDRDPAPRSPATDGPLGRERLLAGPVHGPHVLVLTGRLGTIAT